jgi:hypothetical protein
MPPRCIIWVSSMVFDAPLPVGNSIANAATPATTMRKQRRRQQRQIVIPADQSTETPANLELFTCSRRGGLRLSPAGCGRLGHSANKTAAPELWEGRAACRGCHIGESNHTGSAPDPYVPLRESVRLLCSRCGRVTRRMIRPESVGFCISCYNRDRECRIGQNARGHRPALTAELHTEDALVTTSTGGTYPLTRHRVLHFAELVRQETWNATESLTFVRLIKLTGSAKSENSAVGTLNEVQPLAGSGESANEASSAGLAKPKLTPRPRPVKWWLPAVSRDLPRSAPIPVNWWGPNPPS